MAVVFVLRRHGACGSVGLCTATDLEELEVETLREEIAELKAGEPPRAYPSERPPIPKRSNPTAQANPHTPGERERLPIRKRKI